MVWESLNPSEPLERRAECHSFEVGVTLSHSGQFGLYYTHRGSVTYDYHEALVIDELFEGPKEAGGDARGGLEAGRA
jgi:hypothetical protein